MLSNLGCSKILTHVSSDIYSKYQTFTFIFYAQKQLLLSAHLSHHNSVRPSVHLSVTWVDQSKVVQARITKFSLLAAWKTLVSGNV